MHAVRRRSRILCASQWSPSPARVTCTPAASTTQPSPRFAWSQQRRSRSISSSRVLVVRSARTGSPPCSHAPPRMCLHPIGEALRLDAAEIAILEQTAQQTAGSWIDGDGGRHRPCLQTRRQVRHLTDHTAFLGFPEPTRSPTTTRPVPTPIRTWSGSTLPSFPTASMSASPHRTSRLASSSCACR
jgi:hypothetical protein